MLIFAVVFSLTAFSGSLLSGFQLPNVHLARATPAPCGTPGHPCSENWIPAGPAMDTLLATIFTDESTEFTDIQTLNPTIDMTDWPLTPDLIPKFTTDTNFYITDQISEHGYFEIEFMLGASAFWGCNMNFGNSQCGIDIRQGIQHLQDKTKFTNPTTGEPTIRGISSPIDNPLPTSNGGLPTPNPCLWDNGIIPAALTNTFTTAPVPGTMLETGSQCTVGAVGGTAYHLATASGVGTPSNWQPSLSDLDMCAAAAHFIEAGLATGVVADNANPTLRNCTLTGRSAAVTTNGIVFFVRSDNTPRLHLGDSMAQVICALFTGAYTTGCGNNPTADNILKVQHGPITAFTGFTTSTDHVDVSWHMYTAAFGGIFPFDISLFLIFNSRFVSGISSIHVANGGTCTNDSVPTASAGNYMYVCKIIYDKLSNLMEFAQCLSAPGDPTIGQVDRTLGLCTGVAAAGNVVVYDEQGDNVVGNPTDYNNMYDTPPALPVNCVPGPPICPEAVIFPRPLLGPLPANGDPLAFDPSIKFLDAAGPHVGLWDSPPRNVGAACPAAGCYDVAQPYAACNAFAGESVYWDPANTGSAIASVRLCGPAFIPTQTNPLGILTCSIGKGIPGATIPLTPYANGPNCNPGFDNTTNIPAVAASLGVATTVGTGSGDTQLKVVVPSANKGQKGLFFHPQFSAISAGLLAENEFGQEALTKPEFQQSDQFGYLRCSPTARPCDTSAAGIAATWHRAINHFGAGLPNYFTWLDAWNQNPTQPGTIRQGFKQTTRSVSPFIASTVWDGYIEGSVYDTLHIVNPLNNAEDLSWMDISTLPQTSLTYTPPGGSCPTGVNPVDPPGCTALTYRMTLMPNLSWQDGRPVTAFDVAFSYGTMLANGAFQSGGASVLTGVTILSPTQFDLNIHSFGPFTKLTLTGIPIFPGRYWTCGTGTQPSSGVAPNIIPAKCPATAPANWDSAISTCTSVGNTCYPVQYTLGTAPAQSVCYPNAASPCSLPAVCSLSGCASFVVNLMNVDATKTGALYDPIKDHSFIGSGPWTCGTGAGLGQNCAPGGIMNPGTGQSYSLQRNGLGITPGFPGDFFRSSGFLATYLWTGDLPGGVNNFSAAKACFGVTPLDPLSASPPASACGHWQQGIGTNGATTPAGTGGCPAGATPCGIPVGSNQISIVKLYININWVYSDVWNSANPPNGIIPLDPLLYAGSGGTLSPATGTGSVGCASAYPAGGYDC